MAKPYIKVYFKALDYPLHKDTFVPSELSDDRAVDIHHITTRDSWIENLMALTRDEHTEYGDKKNKMYFLLKRHKDFLDRKGIVYKEWWFEKEMKKYKHLAE